MTDNVIEFPSGNALQIEKDRMKKKAKAAFSPEALEKLCRDYIQQQEITCSETIYQTDRVAETAMEFVESVCDMVGYWVPDEEDAG